MKTERDRLYDAAPQRVMAALLLFTGALSFVACGDRGSNSAQPTAGPVTATLTITSSIPVGRVLAIQVDDADLDTDATMRQTTTVAVVNDATRETENVDLVETGVDTGVFAGLLSTAFAAGAAVSGDGVLGVRAGDTVTMRYTDARNSLGASAILTATSRVTAATSATVKITTAITPGIALAIRVDDADLDTDVTTQQTTTVNVVNDVTGESELAILQENGVDTGTFGGIVPTALGTGGAYDDGVLMVRAGDTATVSYFDAVTSAGNSTILTATSVVDAGAPPCGSMTGLTAPLPACSLETPCVRPAGELGVAMLVTPSVSPSCDSPPWSRREVQDVLGYTREICVYQPPGASPAAPRPLVLWFHPGGNGSADLVATQTKLLQKASQFDLTGDPNRLGFVLAAVQGRNLRFPTSSPRDGRHHDFYFRDLASPSNNPDIANADALIDALVQEGGVDPSRIYVMGWSNGAFFGQLYAIARYATRTPGGNRVAAAAVFAAADPFNDISWDPFGDAPLGSGTSCRLANYPASAVPILMVYRSCDAIVPCDAAQNACFSSEPGYVSESWFVEGTTRGFSIQALRIGGLETTGQLDAAVARCTDFSAGCPTGSCDTLPLGEVCLCTVNHSRWPDGTYESAPLFTNDDREIDMLNFLRGYTR